MPRDFDLFGHPLPRNLGEVGRNEHVPTAENVSKVRALVMANWTQKAIAEELGISVPTLRKHYLRDMNRARRQALAEEKAKTLLQLSKAAEEGNVSAMKEKLRLIEREELAIGLGANSPAEEPKKKPPKLGKKEQQNLDARTAHTESSWGEVLH